MSEPVYQDAEHHSGDEKLTFQDIVLNHLNSILKLSRAEWRGGYMTSDSKGRELYIEDTRAKYWNAINSLNDICLPHFDEKMKKAETETDEEQKQLFRKWYVKNREGVPIIRVEEGEEKFKDEKVIIKRKLFRELCKFLKRIEYFNERVESDEV